MNARRRRKHRDRALARRAPTTVGAPNPGDPPDDLISQSTISVTTKYAGPLPPPALLEHYERILPGAAERILAQWEGQTAHRQGLESRVIDANIKSTAKGQVLGFILGLVTLGIAAGLFMTGQSVFGLIALVGEIAALAGVFIYGRRRQEQERARKTQQT